MGLVDHFTQCYHGYLGYSADLQGTYGIHNDDGAVHARPYGKSDRTVCKIQWPEGNSTGQYFGYIDDVIGCGIDRQGRIFFTKNGKSFFPCTNT